MRVAVNEIKAGLSRYIAKARAGEVIEITSHDKPVARLVGIPIGVAGGVDRLLVSGRAQWSGRKPSLRAPVRLGAGGNRLSAIVVADRS